VTQEPKKALETLYASVSWLRKTVLKEQAGIQADLLASKSRYKLMPKSQRDAARFKRKVGLRSQYHRAATLLAHVERSLRALLQNAVATHKRGTWNFQAAMAFESLFRAAEDTIFDKTGSTLNGLPAVVVNHIAELPYTEEIGLYLVQIPKRRHVPLWMGSLPKLQTKALPESGQAGDKAAALYRRITEVIPDLSADDSSLLRAALMGASA
jgi:hypothetical protein